MLYRISFKLATLCCYVLVQLTVAILVLCIFLVPYFFCYRMLAVISVALLEKPVIQSQRSPLLAVLRDQRRSTSLLNMTVTKLSIDNSPAALLSSFYVMNINFPHSLTNFYTIPEILILNQFPKRISIIVSQVLSLLKHVLHIISLPNVRLQGHFLITSNMLYFSNGGVSLSCTVLFPLSNATTNMPSILTALPPS